MDETTNIMKSSVGTFRFTTESFKFIAKHPFLFVHCQIRVCDSTDPKSRCAQGCLRGDRRRRDVTTDDKIYSLAQGPLTFYADEEDAGSTLSGKRKIPNLISYNVFIQEKFLWQFPLCLAPSLTAVSCNRVGYSLSFLPTYKWSLTNITKNTYTH